MRFEVTQGTERFDMFGMVSYYCAAVALSLRDVGLDLETLVLSHSWSQDRQTDIVLSAEVKVCKLTSSLCYGSELSDTDAGIFVNLQVYILTAALDVSIVRVSGNVKKRGHAVAGISISFRFINFC